MALTQDFSICFLAVLRAKIMFLIDFCSEFFWYVKLICEGDQNKSLGSVFVIQLHQYCTKGAENTSFQPLF